MLSRLVVHASASIRAGALCAALLASACGDTAPGPMSTETPDAQVPEAGAWAPAFDATSMGWLLNVWGSSRDNLYTVGGEPDHGLVMHSTGGGAWSPVELGLDVPLLNWIHGFGPSDITIVGNRGTVVHWDGQGWSRQPTPTDQDLWGVWGAAPDDLWAVGGSGLREGDATLLHFDGRAWTPAELPALQRASVYAFYKVWGTGAGNVYVVGQRGAVLRWDGARWNEELVGASADLISLWGTGPDHIVAVGGRGNGIASVWDGHAWNTVSLAPYPGLNGIWLQNDRVAHVVGNSGTLLRLDLESLEATEEPYATTLDVHSVFGVGGELLAVGGSLTYEAGPYEGIALMRVMGAED